MTSKEGILYSLSSDPLPIIDPGYPFSRYKELDLSIHNTELSAFDITDPAQCQQYIDNQLVKDKAQIAYGGYLEERNLYKNSPNFPQTGAEERNIHLGLDVWAPAGTSVLVPLDGQVHSIRDNKGPGNYGPTVILKHTSAPITFYTLYGHLSSRSLEKLESHKMLRRGEVFASLGTPIENGHYAPHLHFQVIFSLEDYLGDYPGVCSKTSLEFYKLNCPDPNLLLKIPG